MASIQQVQLEEVDRNMLHTEQRMRKVLKALNAYMAGLLCFLDPSTATWHVYFPRGGIVEWQEEETGSGVGCSSGFVEATSTSSLSLQREARLFFWGHVSYHFPYLGL